MVKEEVIEIIKRYAEALKEKGVNFRKIILFGSYAAGRQRRDSDIDIAVVSGDFGKDRFEEGVLLSKEDFNEETWQTLLHEIKSKGIEIAA